MTGLRILVNPIHVTLNAKTDEWSRTVFEAISAGGVCLATILPRFDPGNRRLEMKDELTGRVYSLPLKSFFTEDDKMRDDWKLVLEEFLNLIDLTQFERPRVDLCH